jgi:alkylation response protein AidB-like acyl-CoA dehydrogenase
MTDDQPDIARLVSEFERFVGSVDHADATDILGVQYDHGLAWPTFDRGFGGLGLSPEAANAVSAAVQAVGGVPPTSGDFVAVHQVARLIHDRGTVEQRHRFLRRIFTGEDHWCQLFSEPGAGSDLAGVATSAIPAGSGWVVDGQKVWTSGARHADWALLLARSDSAVVKHRGLSMFVVEMSAPGVTVRPLRQADGGARFSEVFLENVPVEPGLRIGAAGDGWSAALAVLSTERTGASDIFLRPVDELLTRLRELSDDDVRKPLLRDQVMQVWLTGRTLSLMNTRQRAESRPAELARLAALAKVTASEHAQRYADLLATLVGPDILVAADYASAFEHDMDPASAGGLPNLTRLSPTRYLLRSRAMSIEGGTNEIQRNIIGERVLGLPPDIRIDKDVPWRELSRGRVSHLAPAAIRREFA